MTAAAGSEIGLELKIQARRRSEGRETDVQEEALNRDSQGEEGKSLGLQSLHLKARASISASVFSRVGGTGTQAGIYRTPVSCLLRQLSLAALQPETRNGGKMRTPVEWDSGPHCRRRGAGWTVVAQEGTCPAMDSPGGRPGGSSH